MFISKKKHFVKSVIWIGAITLLTIIVESYYSIDADSTFSTTFERNINRYGLFILFFVVVLPAILTFFRERVIDFINRLVLISKNNEHLIRTLKFGILYLGCALPISYVYYGKHTKFDLDSTVNFIQLAVPSVILYFVFLLCFSHVKFKIKSKLKQNKIKK